MKARHIFHSQRLLTLPVLVRCPVRSDTFTLRLLTTRTEPLAVPRPWQRLPAWCWAALALAVTLGSASNAKSVSTVVAWGLTRDGQTTTPAGLTDVVAIAGGTSRSFGNWMSQVRPIGWADKFSPSQF